MVDAARLRRTQDIASVRAAGVIRRDPHFTLRALATGSGSLRLAVSSSRELGTAVRRNRARRRVREALREALRTVPAVAGSDVVVSARRPALDAPPAALREAALRAVEFVTGWPIR